MRIALCLTDCRLRRRMPTNEAHLLDDLEQRQMLRRYELWTMEFYCFLLVRWCG